MDFSMGFIWDSNGNLPVTGDLNGIYMGFIYGNLPVTGDLYEIYMAIYQ